ncbi:MAG: hypothetical protein ABI821_05345 [Pseudomonadota bacterium]
MNLRAASLSAASLLLAVLAGCGPRSEDATPPHPDWVINSQVAFYEADLKTPRAGPREPLRLWVPYVVGDIYGSPNEGEIAPVELRPDLTFTINLNVRHLRLGPALVPTAFSQKWMTIEPAAARVARVSPFIVPKDGGLPLGMSEWLDTDTGTRLLLIYLDRPARIRGEIVHQGRNLSWDIDAKQAGYVWVSQPQESGVYLAVPQPAHLQLAVMPNS